MDLSRWSLKNRKKLSLKYSNKDNWEKNMERVYDYVSDSSYELYFDEYLNYIYNYDYDYDYDDYWNSGYSEETKQNGLFVKPINIQTSHDPHIDNKFNEIDEIMSALF